MSPRPSRRSNHKMCRRVAVLLSLSGLVLALCSSPISVAKAEAVPWQSAHSGDVPPSPNFLDTTDRRIRDTRPAPSAEKLEALRELEKEAGRFVKGGSSFHDTILSLVRREYVRQRVEREQEFSEQIRAEEKEEDSARLAAIIAFERFVAKYPNDPTYTADAMFRLGELYFERDAIKRQVDMDAYLDERDRRLDAGESIDDLVEPEKTFAATISLYRRLIRDFTGYERLDGAYYLIGYCLNEMGEPEEARLAWLNLVCGNQYQYKQPSEKLSTDDLGPTEGEPIVHPALTLDKTSETFARSAFADPYSGCTPTIDDSRFFAETWLRIGEYHFDLDYSEHGLSRAISAYKNVLSKPEDRNFNLALYKVAWAHYRASHYPEAMAHFWQLVQWSEDERLRTGKQGSELREEALQYLGIGFAYDDWNENQLPDHFEGQATGIERVQDPSLLPQDRTWTSEVYFRLGEIYFDEAKFPEAIKVWKLALRRWPMHPEAPQIQDRIAQAHVRYNESDAAVDARAKLGTYAEGSAWWKANAEHPALRRRAKTLAEEALISTAVNQHQDAQRLRRRCVEQQDLSLCTQAQAQYRAAASAYRHYIETYPNNPQAYELRFNLADALYWSENYREAAIEYAAVRDSNLDDTYLSTAARLVVESNKRLADLLVQNGELEVRNAPPEPSGKPRQVQPVELPETLQDLARAREMYLARVAAEQDAENVRDAYAYNNTLLLYQYGYWDLARERFYAIYADRCSGPRGDETGQVAWINLRNIAVSLNQTDEVRRLGVDLEERACTFSADGVVSAAVDCSNPENGDHPRCLAGADLTNLRYRDSVAIFEKAEQSNGDDQRLLYEQAATELVKAVNEEPGHPQAPLALEKAAIALERTSRFESAARLYQRIVDEVGPRQAADEAGQQALDAILANAYFRLAFNANRFFDFDRAVENYRLLADSKRFAKSGVDQMKDWREGALVNAATILEYQQEYGRAAAYFSRAGDVLEDPSEKRAARYRVAEMAYKLERWSRAIREMRSFIRSYSGDPAAGEYIVQAYWRIAEARKALGQKKDYVQAVNNVVTGFASSGQPAGSFAAEYAAKSHFQLVDADSAAFEKFNIRAGTPKSLKAYVEKVKKQITAGAVEAKARAEAYNAVPPYQRPVWTVAALVKQGRTYEILARAILNTPFVVPADLKKKMRGLPFEAQEDIKIQVEDAIRQLLDQQVRPIECLAVARYALASRASRAGNIDNEFSREASNRINAYGDERIAECVEQAAQQDSSFQAYQPGEFTRAPRGETMNIPPGVAPPALGGGGR